MVFCRRPAGPFESLPHIPYQSYPTFQPYGLSKDFQETEALQICLDEVANRKSKCWGRHRRQRLTPEDGKRLSSKCVDRSSDNPFVED